MENVYIKQAIELIKSTFTDSEYNSLTNNQKNKIHIKTINIIKGRKPLPVGTIRIYNGEKYIKHQDGWIALTGNKKGKLVDFKNNLKIHHNHSDKIHKKFYEENKNNYDNLLQKERRDKIKEIEKIGDVSELRRINDDLATALFSWTSNYYTFIRDLQRGNNVNDDYKEKAQKYLKILEKNFDDLPNYNGKIIRDIEVSNGFIEKYFTLNKIYEIEAFSSFTYNEEGYRSYYNTTLIVNNNKSGKKIAGFSKYYEEKEILVPKGTKYKVLKIDIKGEGDFKKTNVYLEEIMEKSINNKDNKIFNDLFNEPLSNKNKKVQKSTPYEMIEDDIDKLLKGGIGSGRKKGPPITKEQMLKRIKEAKKRLKEAEEKGDHMEIIGLKNWLSEHDK